MWTRRGRGEASGGGGGSGGGGARRGVKPVWGRGEEGRKAQRTTTLASVARALVAARPMNNTAQSMRATPHVRHRVLPGGPPWWRVEPCKRRVGRTLQAAGRSDTADRWSVGPAGGGGADRVWCTAGVGESARGGPLSVSEGGQRAAGGRRSAEGGQRASGWRAAGERWAESAVCKLVSIRAEENFGIKISKFPAASGGCRVSVRGRREACVRQWDSEGGKRAALKTRP